MWFRKQNKIIDAIENRETDGAFGTIVKKQFAKNRLAVWSLRMFYVILFIGIFADFIANEKPIYCQIEGRSYFPVFKEYAVDLGLAKWDPIFLQKDWMEQEYDFAILALIPYSANTLDHKNRSFKSPFAKQDIKSNRYRHWLGTELLGRDIAAGMVAGTRVAMLVGLIVMFIALLLGILMGSFAGYFGDDRLQISRGRLLLMIPGLLLAVFYAFIARTYVLSEGSFGLELLKSLLIFILIIGFTNVVAHLLKNISFFKKKVTIAVDIIVMRIIEVFNSIPAIFLLLAVLSILKNQSIFSVMVILGLVSWPGIARFVRGELLRIRNLEYVEAARAIGLSEWRIIFKHALPNALTPVLIILAFGFASSILAESALSFLGIGLSAESISWGKMLSIARDNFSAWWLAVFPGMAIFITVTLLNLIGEGLTDALDPRLRE